jgi:predicted regulator of Ras-like GTPase activity (Roadblock/LC7/MglB family)
MSREINAWQKELKRNPGAPAFARLAERLREEGEIGEAIWVCSRGLMANPEYSTGHAILAEILLENGLRKRAREEFSLSLKLDGNNARSRMGLAQLLLAEGDIQQALSELDYLLFWQPTHLPARQLREEAVKREATQQVNTVLGSVPVACQPEPPQEELALPSPPGLVPGREKEFTALLEECESVGGVFLVNQEGLVIVASAALQGLGDRVAAKLISVSESSNRYLMKLGLGYLEGILIEGEELTLRILRYDKYLAAISLQPGAQLGAAEAELTKVVRQLDRRRKVRATDIMPQGTISEVKHA